MSFALTQKLNQISEGGEAASEILNQWTNKITTNNMPGHFITVIENSIAEAATQREIRVKLMDLALAPAETVTDTGNYERQPGETSVKVTLLDQAGEEVASCIADYPNEYTRST